MPRVRPSIIPEHKRGFTPWRSAVFAGVATGLFLVVAFGITAYFGFTSRGSVDTEEVGRDSAERFGRFSLPAGATEPRFHVRGTPLGGELMVRFRLPKGEVEAFIASTPQAAPLRPDARLALRLVTASDKVWWRPPAPALAGGVPRPAAAATGPANVGSEPTATSGERPETARRFLAGVHADAYFTQIVLIEAPESDRPTVYVYATNR